MEWNEEAVRVTAPSWAEAHSIGTIFLKVDSRVVELDCQKGGPKLRCGDDAHCLRLGLKRNVCLGNFCRYPTLSVTHYKKILN